MFAVLSTVILFQIVACRSVLAAGTRELARMNLTIQTGTDGSPIPAGLSP